MTRIGSRIAALAFAAAFAGSSAVDALGLHPCPHHGVPAGAETQDSAVEGGRHAANDAAASGHDLDGGGSHDGHGGPCTCVGTCQVDASSPLALLSSSGGAAWSPPFRATSLAPVAIATLPGPPPFLLPYSHGPPPALRA